MAEGVDGLLRDKTRKPGKLPLPAATVQMRCELVGLTENVRIIEYPGEIGVSLQHLGILVGRQAHADVWPEIISWLNTCG
jgi:hypothetical protein